MIRVCFRSKKSRHAYIQIRMIQKVLKLVIGLGIEVTNVMQGLGSQLLVTLSNKLLGCVDR